MEYLDIAPMPGARGVVRLPGSKSLSNRLLLVAALARGETVLRDVLESDDTARMLTALSVLGVSCAEAGLRAVSVRGAGGPFSVRRAELFLGNAGTAFRPLTAVLALCGGEYRLSGVPRMHERPIGDLADALRSLGCRIDYLGVPGYPPLAIHPGTLHDVDTVHVRGNVSSQFLTGLLIALPLTGRRMTVCVDGELISKPYVDITLNTMARFGVTVERDGWNRYVVPHAPYYASPGEIYVEGDASSASYFLAAGVLGALRGGGPVRVEGVGRNSIQGDVRFADLLERMGARVTWGDNWIEATADDATRRRGRLSAITADCNHVPDAAMTLAVCALFADGTTALTNIGSWRVKETDRISAMATELRKLGAQVDEGPDYLKVTPPPDAMRAAVAIDTYDDHRIAMSFALVAAGGMAVRINDPRCVAKTFPAFFEVLAGIAGSNV